MNITDLKVFGGIPVYFQHISEFGGVASDA